MIVVYSYYVLDLIHKGHLLQMWNAKKMAGKDGRSVVGILTDEAAKEIKPKPVMPFTERIRLAQALGCVDLVVAQTQYLPTENIRRIRPDIVLDSESHSPEIIQQVRTSVEDVGGRLIVMPYYPGCSSSKMKEEIKNVPSQ